MKPTIGKKYKLHINPCKYDQGSYQEEWIGSGTCYGYEGFGLWLFNKLKPKIDNEHNNGNFLEQDIIKEIK